MFGQNDSAGSMYCMYIVLIFKVMHTCQDMILMCLWQGDVVDCANFFSVKKTDNGFCCSFNTPITTRAEQL